jgi:hypothetical protein
MTDDIDFAQWMDEFKIRFYTEQGSLVITSEHEHAVQYLTTTIATNTGCEFALNGRYGVLVPHRDIREFYVSVTAKIYPWNGYIELNKRNPLGRNSTNRLAAVSTALQLGFGFIPSAFSVNGTGTEECTVYRIEQVYVEGEDAA